MTNNTNLKLHQRLWQLAENLGMAFVVSAVVSGGITVYFESRLENSKQSVESLEASSQQFDSSHNALVAEVGVYTNTLMLGEHTPDKDKILTAIINAQSQLLQLKSQLGATQYAAINAYGKELNHLSDAVNSSRRSADLHPVFDSVQNLLDDHEQIDKTVKANANVSMF